MRRNPEFLTRRFRPCCCVLGVSCICRSLQRRPKMPRPTQPKNPPGSHAEMRVENLPRRPHVVTFDNALSALKLAPAANGRGAVLDGWTDPIGEHDKKVIEVEQAMLKEKDLVSAETRSIARRSIARARLRIPPILLLQIADSNYCYSPTSIVVGH